MNIILISIILIIIGEICVYDSKKQNCNSFNRTVNEINSLIDYLYFTPSWDTKYTIACQLKYKIQELQYMNTLICEGKAQIPNQVPQNLLPQSIPVQVQNQRTFTLTELSDYDGKDGMPAYVAVNGIVYDVTNNATWAAASHFGLSAGRDLTNEFERCHAGQPILNNLTIVGKLIT